MYIPLKKQDKLSIHIDSLDGCDELSGSTHNRNGSAEFVESSSSRLMLHIFQPTTLGTIQLS